MKTAEQKITYLDSMGTDLSVANAARVSFDKVSEELSKNDEKLISFLAKHNHWSPFSHTSVSFRIKAPIFVARQLAKHQVGFAWNEVSRRYVDNEPEFFIPHKLRSRAENVKQGSGAETIKEVLHPRDEDMNVSVLEAFMWTAGDALETYNALLKSNVCPEQARMVLPQNTMTEWIWTGSLYGWARMCQLRMDSHTQIETQEIAKKIASYMESLFPISWKALVNDSTH